MDLQEMILEWVKDHRCSGPWMLHLWCHLMERGVSSGDAVTAIEQFVNAVILAKSRKPLPTLW
jgi:hypothetical protein